MRTVGSSRRSGRGPARGSASLSYGSRFRSPHPSLISAYFRPVAFVVSTVAVAVVAALAPGGIAFLVLLGWLFLLAMLASD